MYHNIQSNRMRNARQYRAVNFDSIWLIWMIWLICVFLSLFSHHFHLLLLLIDWKMNAIVHQVSLVSTFFTQRFSSCHQHSSTSFRKMSVKSVGDLRGLYYMRSAHLRYILTLPWQGFWIKWNKLMQIKLPLLRFTLFASLHRSTLIQNVQTNSHFSV